MKKAIIAIIVFLLLNSFSPSYATDNLILAGEAGILIDGETGQVLYEKNAHLQLYPASTTKIMTGILAIELGKMDDIVTVDQEVVNLTDGSHIALEPGEQVKLEYLMYALLVESANDSALAIAKHISGSIDGFAKLMNEKAKKIGALNTNFVNPNGLHDENHVTTAYDLALIAKYAMQNENFRQIVANYTYLIPPTNKKTEARPLNSANKLLYSNQKIDVDGKAVPIKYEGVNGVKTGYTQMAQNCLVTSAQKGNQKLISVVLKSNGRNVYSDTHKLLNYGFNNFEKVTLAYNNEFIDNIKIQNGKLPLIAGIIKNSLTLTIPKGSKDNIEKKIILNEAIEAPIEKEQSLGKVEYFLKGEKIGETDIVSSLAVEEIPKVGMFKKILDKWYIILFLILIISRSVYLIKKKKRRKKRSSLYKVPSSLK
ncbi:D-alanyl-D-alanine carboxypeptidase [Tissierella sp. MSJ-40]|uniref:D-alanyl-D-alanine carboxypeptidase n=1 Tax=Tissierella simiarum TaxID=2841534 RepID=A0ABS6EAW9_9FIRM|nr:D-alanyl-D-alanine carboxypeptidase family protein [Tissierella simiarum]MBU5440006.1 D-alanyl-D-alanine carboxypeptidase [Tissierella simiarum]